MSILHRLFARVSSGLMVEDTGTAMAEGSSHAVTGYEGPEPKKGQHLTVRNTGDAVAKGGSKAASGIDYT